MSNILRSSVNEMKRVATYINAMQAKVLYSFQVEVFVNKNLIAFIYTGCRRFIAKAINLGSIDLIGFSMNLIQYIFDFNKRKSKNLLN